MARPTAHDPRKGTMAAPVQAGAAGSSGEDGMAPAAAAWVATGREAGRDDLRRRLGGGRREAKGERQRKVRGSNTDSAEET